MYPLKLLCRIAIREVIMDVSLIGTLPVSKKIRKFLQEAGYADITKYR